VPSKVKSENGKQLSKSALKLRLLKRLKCTTRFERELWASGAQLVAGVDEVGRGALFGPVVAGAVILDPKYRIKGLRDSKLLPANRREILAERIKEHCIAWSVAAVDVARIDQLNIYHATRLAMTEAVQALAPAPDCLLIDAMKLALECRQKSIIRGDALSASIAAASIVAKVERDRMIRTWDPVFPVLVTVYTDRTFTFILKTPPASILLLRAAGIVKGSAEPNRNKVGKVTKKQVEEIAKIKMPDLNCFELESAMRSVEGTARSMGVDVV